MLHKSAEQFFLVKPTTVKQDWNKSCSGKRAPTPLWSCFPFWKLRKTVKTNQGFHLQKLAGAVLSLAAWNDPEHQETKSRETHLSKRSTVGAQDAFNQHKHITSAPKHTERKVYEGLTNSAEHLGKGHLFNFYLSKLFFNHLTFITADGIMFHCKNTAATYTFCIFVDPRFRKQLLLYFM